MTLPANYTNETIAKDVHPGAHNDANAAVNALDANAVRRANRGRPGHYVWAFPTANVGAYTWPVGYLVMTRINADVRFDAAAVEVMTPIAASSITVAVYDTDGDAMPTTLARSATVETTTAAWKVATFAAVDPGVYWLGWRPSHGIAVRAANHALGLYVSPTAALPAPAATLNGWSLFSATFPDPFPVGTAASTVSVPWSLLRVAA